MKSSKSLIALVALVTLSHTAEARASAISASAACNRSESLGPTCLIGDGYHLSNAAASAKYGVLKVWATASQTVPDAPPWSAGARASWMDWVTISSPGMDGKLGHMTASLAYSSFLDVNLHESDVWAEYSAFALVGFAFSASPLGAVRNEWYRSKSIHEQVVYGDWYSETTTTAMDRGDPSKFGTALAADWDFVFGRPFYINADLRVVASVLNGVGDAIADSSHSVYWEGIQNVTSDGREVPYELISESGTDWRESFAPLASEAPEPSSLFLTLAGLAAAQMLTLGANGYVRRGACGPS